MINKDVKLSGRAKRMEHLKGRHTATSLNLVSLMDIFTILVFFLLVSSGSQQLPNSKAITLPTTVASKVPKETLIVAITKTDILVKGKKVLSIADAENLKTEVLAELQKELQFQAAKRQLSELEQKAGRAVTIMGDENISYQLLRKILETCRQVNYTRVAFAAFQKARG